VAFERQLDGVASDAGSLVDLDQERLWALPHASSHDRSSFEAGAKQTVEPHPVHSHSGLRRQVEGESRLVGLV
jgi:hypothetical protein